MELLTKPTCCADVSICLNDDDSGLMISAALPGVDKKDITLNMRSDSFCLAGERDDYRYDCCYELPCDVDVKKSDAHYDNGLLKVAVPFKKDSIGKAISIH